MLCLLGAASPVLLPAAAAPALLLAPAAAPPGPWLAPPVMHLGAVSKASVRRTSMVKAQMEYTAEGRASARGRPWGYGNYDYYPSRDDFYRDPEYREDDYREPYARSAYREPYDPARGYYREPDAPPRGYYREPFARDDYYRDPDDMMMNRGGGYSGGAEYSPRELADGVLPGYSAQAELIEARERAKAAKFEARMVDKAARDEARMAQREAYAAAKAAREEEAAVKRHEDEMRRMEQLAATARGRALASAQVADVDACRADEAVNTAEAMRRAGPPLRYYSPACDPYDCEPEYY